MFAKILCLLVCLAAWGLFIMLLPVDNGVEAQQPVQEQVADEPLPVSSRPALLALPSARRNIPYVLPIWIDEPEESYMFLLATVTCAQMGVEAVFGFGW